MTAMEELKDRITAIIGGGSFGVFGGIKLFQIPMQAMPWEFPLKMFGTIILSAIGGLVGLLIKDFYQHRIKYWWINKIKKDK